MNDEKFYSGFISLTGRPNVGKSTLMNLLTGEKTAIVTSKPQTTRNKIQAILTRENFQMIFVDTPGIHKPKSKLGNYMVKSAEKAIGDVDIILYLVQPYNKVNNSDMEIIERFRGLKTPVFLIINKIDTVEHSVLLSVIDAYKDKYDFAEIIPISALKGENIQDLIETLKKYLPEGPMYFPSDAVTDQPERQIAAEMIREKALKLLEDEIPHGIAVEVISMSKRKDKEITDVQAVIYCEKDSHKGIIIGKKGEMLKKIGSNARQDIERLEGNSVNLQLWVKVKNKWRDNDFLLKNFGYDKKNI